MGIVGYLFLWQWREGKGRVETDVDEKPADDLVVVDPIGFFLLFDEPVEVVFLRVGVVPVGALEAGHGALNAHRHDCAEGCGADAVDGVLVEEFV